MPRILGDIVQRGGNGDDSLSKLQIPVASTGGARKALYALTGKSQLSRCCGDLSSADLLDRDTSVARVGSVTCTVHRFKLWP